MKAFLDASTAANQTTLIIVAVIGASASLLSACITGVFGYMLVRVRRVTEATHSIVNHDRQVMLEAQAQTLRVASLDHPKDEALRLAFLRAERAATDAAEGNDLPASRL